MGAVDVIKSERRGDYCFDWGTVINKIHILNLVDKMGYGTIFNIFCPQTACVTVVKMVCVTISIFFEPGIISSAYLKDITILFYRV